MSDVRGGGAGGFVVGHDPLQNENGRRVAGGESCDSRASGLPAVRKSAPT